MIEQYMALALQPTMRGCRKRSEVAVNISHISELIDAAVWLSAIDLPVRLICVPEGCLQSFTDEVFDWDHNKYVDEMALDIPGEETEALGRKAKQHNTYIIAQAKVKHPEFPNKFFNGAFIIAPSGEVILKHYKLQVFAREHSTVPHDVWDRWVELYGDGLDAFFPVADTEIGRLGCVICMEGSFPETARGLAMNGAEVLYRPAYPEPYVANGLWEIQNRARALDKHLLRGCAQPSQLFPHPGIGRCARYFRRKVHDRGLSGQNSFRAWVWSWAFVRRGHPRHRGSAPVSHSFFMGQLAQGFADGTIPLHLRTGALSQEPWIGEASGPSR